jgi:chromosome segregation ATPase
MSTATMTKGPGLAERLAATESAVAPLRNRVAELESVLKAAVAAEDFSAAEQAKAELPGLREQLVIAEAAAAGLREGAARIEAARQAEQDAIDKARQAEAARAELNRAQAAFTAAQEKGARIREQLDPALGAVREIIAAGMAADSEAQAAADAMADTSALLQGTGPPLRHNLIQAPMGYLLEVDEMVSMIWRRKDPVDGRMWPR